MVFRAKGRNEWPTAAAALAAARAAIAKTVTTLSLKAYHDKRRRPDWEDGPSKETRVFSWRASSLLEPPAARTHKGAHPLRKSTYQGGALRSYPFRLILRRTRCPPIPAPLTGPNPRPSKPQPWAP